MSLYDIFGYEPIHLDCFQNAYDKYFYTVSDHLFMPRNNMDRFFGESVYSLATILASYFPNDILIPCKKGEKIPMFAHKYGIWNWEKFITFFTNKYKEWTMIPNKKKWNSPSDQYYSGVDIAIVLHDICVVDIDDPQLITDFENKFHHILQNVPIVQTKKGRHYYFKRSKFADEYGYFDGRAQKIKGIDFKTISKTGSGGIIMVPPSTDKMWISKGNPDDKYTHPILNIFEIPTEILQFVAVPQFTVSNDQKIVFRFNDGEFYNTKANAIIQNMGILEPYFSEDGFTLEDPIDIPIQKDIFLEILSIIQNKRLNRKNVPTDDWLIQIINTIRFIGFKNQETLIQEVLYGIPHWQNNTYKMFPEWWSKHVIEREEKDKDLVDIKKIVQNDYNQTIFTPFRIDELPPDMTHDRLFATICNNVPHNQRPHGKKIGQSFIIPDNDETPIDIQIDHRIDPRVQTILKTFSEQTNETGVTAFLAGGSTLQIMTHQHNEGFHNIINDYDIYLVGNDEIPTIKSVNSVLQTIQSILIPSSSQEFQMIGKNEKQKSIKLRFLDQEDKGYFLAGKYAMTIIIPPLNHDKLTTRQDQDKNVMVQIIFKRFAFKSQVLSGFDFSPCKIGISWDENSSSWNVLASPTFLPSMKRMAFPIDLERWGYSSVHRVMKYFNKGFEIFLPGWHYDNHGNRSSFSKTYSVMSLFYIQKSLLHLSHIDHHKWIDKFPKYIINNITKYQSDYEDTSDEKSWQYVIYSTLKRGFNTIINSFNWNLIKNQNNNEDFINIPSPTQNNENTENIEEMSELVKDLKFRWPIYDPKNTLFRPAYHRWYIIAKNRKNKNFEEAGFYDLSSCL